MLSYSQNFEDVILNRCFKPGHRGFYIDIGAANPDIGSLTKHFYNNGWHGINIEPQVKKIELFIKNRSRDINISAAVGDKEGRAEFYEGHGAAFALSTLHKKYAEQIEKHNMQYSKVEVPIITLDSIVEKYKVQHCDFLNIDCEGNEREVFLGWKNQGFTPSIVVIESIAPMVSPQDQRIETHAEWESLILEKNYKFVYADGINRFYLHASCGKMEKYFRFPPNGLDAFRVVDQEYYKKFYREMGIYWESSRSIQNIVSRLFARFK